jgi:hypothetical protein
MTGWEQGFLMLGICVGGGLGAGITVLVAGLIGFLGDVRACWHTGRKIAQFVTEKEHDRRVELLAKMIELERAMQQVPPEVPVIERRDGTIDEPAAC